MSSVSAEHESDAWSCATASNHRPNVPRSTMRRVRVPGSTIRTRPSPTTSCASGCHRDGFREHLATNNRRRFRRWTNSASTWRTSLTRIVAPRSDHRSRAWLCPPGARPTCLAEVRTRTRGLWTKRASSRQRASASATSSPDRSEGRPPTYRYILGVIARLAPPWKSWRGKTSSGFGSINSSSSTSRRRWTRSRQ